LLHEAGTPYDLEVSVDDSDVTEAKGQVDVPSVFHQIDDSEEDGVQSVLDDILAHKAPLGDGNWVAVDHSEAFLVNGVLTLSGGNFFFVQELGQVNLEQLVNHEAGPAVVHVLSVHSLVVEAEVGLVGGSVLDLGVLGRDVEGESTELFETD
jgi:hypothetical protein